MLNNNDKYLIPDVFNKISQNNLNTILCNYKKLIKDTSDVIEILLNQNIAKPLVMHNVGFLIELSLKYYLIINSELQISEIEKMGHSLILLMEISQQKSLQIDGLNFILQKFRDKNDKKLDFNNYHNFKYNREKGKEALIFEFEYSEKERNNIKEVRTWINQHILLL